MPQREADVVEPFEQAILAEGIDLEFRREVCVVSHCLLFKDDTCSCVRRIFLRAFQQRVDLFFRETNEHDAVLASIRKEDVCERRCDDAAETVVRERPRRMLAR